MAFGNLQGITPQEFLNRFGVNSRAGIPFGVTNFHPSQLSGQFTQPAMPGIGALNPTQAQIGLMPPDVAARFGGPPMTPLDYDRALGMGRPLRTRIPGQFTGSFGTPLAPPQSPFGMNPSAQGSAPRWLDFSMGRQGMPYPPDQPWANPTPPLTPPRSAAVAAASARQAEALARQAAAATGTAGASPIPMGAARTATAAADDIPLRFLIQQQRGPGGQFLPRVPPPNVVGPASPYPAAPQFPLGMMRNGPGPIPMGAGGTLPSPTFQSGPGAVPQGDVRMSAMQQPRPPGAGMSSTPVSIRPPGGAAPGSVDPTATGGRTATAARLATEATGGVRGAAGSLRSGGLRGALGVLGEGSGLGGAGIRGGARTLARRAIPALMAYQGLHGLAGLAGGDSSIAGQALEGAAVAGGIGGGVGGPVAGVVAGGVGAIANPIVDRLTGGRSFTESLSNLMGDNPTGHDVITEQFGESDPEVAQLLDDRLTRLETGADDMWEGVPDDVANALAADFNERAADLDGQELAALQFELAMSAEQAAQAAIMQEQQAGQMPQQLTAADLAATQALASQFMAPVAADSAAIGQMGATALRNLAQPMPGAQGDALRDLARIQQQHGQGMANAYMQQAYVDPQLHMLDQQMAIRDQISQQLTQQAIQSLPQFAQSSGATSFDDLLAQQAATGDTGGAASDLAALIAQG